MKRVRLLASFMALAACSQTTRVPEPQQGYDVLIRGGTLYDGTGGPGVVGDLAIDGDRVVALGEVAGSGDLEIDASGLAVAPGFINMLSWSDVSLIQDGNAESTIRQGVTLEVMGEGWTLGPVNDTVLEYIESRKRERNAAFEIEWKTLGGYLDWLVARGISTNVASFVGQTTVRMYVLGFDDVEPSAQQLEAMQELRAETTGTSSRTHFN